MQCEIQTERNIPPLYDMQTMFSWLDKSRAVVLESGLGHRGINNLILATDTLSASCIIQFGFTKFVGVFPLIFLHS